jgi:lactoylglutathione lyase
MVNNNSKILGLDHYAIEVADVSKSLQFYIGVLGFVQITRPAFDFNGAWIDTGNAHIHLIENRALILDIAGSRRLHFAFEVDDIYSFKSYLLEQHIAIAKDIKRRPDGQLQMFVRDPDGYFIEFTQL